MFLQAGFNNRAHGLRIFAFVTHRHARWRLPRVAELVRFRCGDLAWWGAGGVSWGESLVIHSRFYPRGPGVLSFELESCEIDAAPHAAAR